MPLPDFRSSMDLVISIQLFLWELTCQRCQITRWDGSHHYETRGHVAMMGNLGYELDLTSLSQEELDRIAAQVAHYKTIRPLVQFGKHYRLINPSHGSNQAAVQFTYQDRTVVTYVRVLSTVEEIEPTLKLKGLEEDALYRLEGTDQVYSGAELMYAWLNRRSSSGRFPQQTICFVKK